MDPIRLIRDKAELVGTCYFELLPGEYKGQCWNDESVFLSEEVFGLIEPLFVRHHPGFDHYSFVGIRRPAWERVLTDLERLAARAETATGVGDLRGDVMFYYPLIEAAFTREFRDNADSLARMARDLAAWVKGQLSEHECVSVLGM